MDTEHARHVRDALLNLAKVNRGWNLLEKSENRLLEVFEHVAQDVERDEDGKNRINNVEIVEGDEDTGDKYRDPSKHVFHEVPGGDAFVERFPSPQLQDCQAVHGDSHDRENDHAGRVGVLRREQARHRLRQDEHGANQQHYAVHEGG